MGIERNIAVVGGGDWGKNLIRNFHELGALRCICDIRSELLEHYAQRYGDVRLTGSFSAVLADPEIRGVAVVTPAATHYELAKQALLAGKDVFVEKPMALRREEGMELVGLAEERGRILMVGHVLRYHPAIAKLKQMIDEGQLGKIQYIYSNRLNIGKIRTEENILWSFAPHDISVILMLLEEFPVSVCAQGGNYLNHNVPDVTMTTLSFRSGVRGHIFVSWLHPYKEQKLVVVGDKKMVVFDDAAERDKLVAYAHQVEWIHRRPVARKADAEPVPISDEEPLRIECAHFLDCIATRRTPCTDGREGLAVLSVLELCQRSLDQNGIPISL